MAVSLSSNPAGKDRSYHFDPLKGSPARVSGFYPSLPNVQYMDVFKSTHNLFHPLKSLGRLVTETQTVMPFSFAGAPRLFAQNGHQAAILHEQVLNMAGFPYFNRVPPIFPKHEDLSQVASDHSPGSVSEFSSPSSQKSSFESCSPSKDSALYLHKADPETEQTHTYCFTEEDLFNVLYGYSKNQEKNVGHAISGVAFPGNSGEFETDS